MENIYQFMLKYLEAMSLAKRNGFAIDGEQYKAIEFYDAIKNRANEPLSCHHEDSLDKACHKMYDKFMLSEDREKLYHAFLQYWGIHEEPYKVLYTNKSVIPAKRYVIAFFVDCNGEEERARNGGNGERYYGSGKSKTREQFWKEIQRQYKNCPWTWICNISNVYTEPESILYEFNGFLYREFIKENSYE